MTIFAGTTTTYNVNRLREQFSNAIYMISPEETPFLSLSNANQLMATS
jgi:hypothetical protein